MQQVSPYSAMTGGNVALPQLLWGGLVKVPAWA